MTKLKITLFSLFFVASCSSTLLSQEDNWHDLYEPMTYEQALAVCTQYIPNDSMSCDPSCFNYVELFDLKFKVPFQYLGSAMRLDENHAKYVDRWVKAFWPNGEMNEMFKHQLLFNQGDEEIWIMVQEPTFPYYADELKKGDDVDLYLMFVGTLVFKEQTHFIFVANDFEKK